MVPTKKINSEKGSALILVILIAFSMLTLGAYFVAATMSDRDMSVFFADRNTAYYAAEAGVEQVAKILDEMTAEAQEKAREDTSTDIATELIAENSDLRKPDGSINDDKVKAAFDSYYLTHFKTRMEAAFGDADTATNTIRTALQNTNLGNRGSFELESTGGLDFQYAGNVLAECRMNVVVKGTYIDYNKRLSVTFNLLPDAAKTSYKTVSKLKVRKPGDYPEILNKAVIAEKNIISAGGNVTIEGDVLGFGTVPADSTGNEEDPNAEWYRYGGIMAGMCPEVADRSVEFSFDGSKINHQIPGSFYIKGNAATMAYVHSLYGIQSKPSNISIEGETFARSVKSEENSNFSTMYFGVPNTNSGTVNTIDNLQIDSTSSIMTVNGSYKGFVNAGYVIDGSGNNPADKQARDTFEYKRTSSIVINGDSMLFLNGSVYIGGSTFLKGYTDSGHPYMTGISAIKSSRRIANAFKKDDLSNQGNKLFWYNQNQGVYQDLQQDLQAFKSYIEASTGNAVDMFNGKKTGVGNEGEFPIENRAMHFKGVWDNLWNSTAMFDDMLTRQEMFSDYLNTGNIHIGGSLKGFSYGAIVADGQVYSPYNFVDLHDPVAFADVQRQCIQNFRASIRCMIDDNNANKLNYIAPIAHISRYMDINAVENGVIKVNQPFNVTGKGLVYYGDRDADISQSNGIWYINGREMTPVGDGNELRGIIYVNGNIYIQGGFDFDGVIMASGNVIFLGDAHITNDLTKADRAVGDLLNTSPYVNELFRLNTFEALPGTVQSQRIEKKNVSILQWTEMDN